MPAEETGKLHTTVQPGPGPLVVTDVETCVEHLLARAGRRLVVGAPLGIGKPNQLLNALYRRAAADRRIELTLVTALSLGRPLPRNELERRFLAPFVERHFRGYPELDYLAAMRNDALPRNVRVSEFYLAPGQLLGVEPAQRRYVSSNYTHVARDMIDKGINVVLQLVASRDGADGRSYSLSSNPDVTLDVVDLAAARPAHPLLVVAQVNRRMPFMHGDALVEPSFFDIVLDDEGLDFEPFAVPRTAITTADHMIGLHASALMRDGGTLQVGIGSLGDALVHAMQLRHRRNDLYRQVLDDVGTTRRAGSLIERIGGTDIFAQGIYGASEMFMDGFMRLYESGILKRRVYDDVSLQAGLAAGGPGEDAPPGGVLMHAAFLLGSKDFYAALDALSDDEHHAICMTRVSRINQLYGDERLGAMQRRDARFVNTCMNMTLLGAAASDGLEDGQVVSGVGGQYNFVAMAHALPGGRSILMFRSTRGHGRRLESNALWRYGHATIPRHLRDIAISEYGIADLRGKTDEECIAAMLDIADSRFQDRLLGCAKHAGKIARDYRIPDTSRRNLPERLATTLAPYRARGLFELYPYGSDFTPEEQELARALRRLERRLRTPSGKLAAVSRALLARHDERHGPCLERMGLASPAGLRERVMRGLLLSALRRP